MSEQKQQTLMEKLKCEHDDRELTCQDLFEDGHFDDKKKTELLAQQTGVMAGLQIAIDIVEAHDQETCNWRNNKGTGLWECHYGGDYTSDCGLEWNMSNKDSPSENEMHFCPKCGKKLVEIKPPIEAQDD